MNFNSNATAADVWCSRMSILSRNFYIITVRAHAFRYHLVNSQHTGLLQPWSVQKTKRTIDSFDPKSVSLRCYLIYAARLICSDENT